MQQTPFKARVSLKRQLLLWLLLPQLVLWLSGSWLAWRVAYQNGEKGIDQMLTQSVKALARQIKPLGNGLLVDFPKAAQDILEQDPADPLNYTVTSPPGSFLLGNTKLPSPTDTAPIALGQPMLYRGHLDGKPVRVALLEVDYGTAESKQRLRVQVAQSLTIRDQIAQELLRQMLLPTGLMALVLGALVYVGISRGLAPLKRLEAELELAGAGDPASGATIPAIAQMSAPQEVHSLASTINRLLDAVARGQSREKQFLNDAAHQLRTPLAGLIGQSELALRECQDEKIQARLQKVLSAAQRSAHLVHQLLQLARTEFTSDMQTLNLAQLARDVTREWTGRALQADIDLGYDGAEELWVHGNTLLLREALGNLLDNALQYAGAGSVVTVRVHRPNAPHAELTVEDNGPGVHPEDIPRMFGRFWRGSDKPGGCGLGLAIVREIAHRHAGTVRAETLQPQGLQITVSLPLRQ